MPCPGDKTRMQTSITIKEESTTEGSGKKKLLEELRDYYKKLRNY